MIICVRRGEGRRSTRPGAARACRPPPGPLAHSNLRKLHIAPRPPPAPRRGHGGARCSAVRTARRPPGARRATPCTLGGGGGPRRRRRAVGWQWQRAPGAWGPRRQGRACGRGHTWSPGGEWPYTLRGMRACVSVYACTTVRPLAWAVAQQSALKLQQSASAHAHASIAGWPTCAHAPAE